MICVLMGGRTGGNFFTKYGYTNHIRHTELIESQNKSTLHVGTEKKATSGINDVFNRDIHEDNEINKCC